MWDEALITELARKYNFQVRIFVPMVYVKSKCDEWCFEECKDGYLLYHINHAQAPFWHKQRVYAKLEHLFDSIYKHDLWRMGKLEQIDSKNMLLQLNAG